ncbi:MAG: tetratricopeptide repeat protein [Chloroflexota bacterium]
MARSYKLLGSLEIAENGRLSPLMKSNKLCAILCYLIVTNKPQARTHIANLFWEGRPPREALRNLRQLLFTTGKQVPELLVTASTLTFQPTSDTHVDFHLLQAALSQRDPDQLTWTNHKQLEHALPLYRGALLNTFYLEEAPRFDEWLAATRERLRSDVFVAYHHLCSVYQEKQAWEAGIIAGRRWLAIDNLNEEAHRFLILYLLENGQLIEAQQQYKTCRSLLWTELGIEPENETQLLLKKIDTISTTEKNLLAVGRIQRVPPWQPDLLPEPEALPAPSSLPPNAVIPYQRNEDFIGRETALLQLGQWLLPWEASHSQDGRQVVALCGIGGVGKTQLAIEYVHRYGRFYTGGVYWMSFAQANSVAEEIAAIGGENGMRLYSSADKLTLVDQVGRVQQAWQQITPRLLIFDNCEEEALLEKWLPVSGGCRVLLTSRRGVWSPNLGVTVQALDGLPRQESIKLLTRLVDKMTAGNADKIAAEVGDLPLALFLAGSFLRRYPQVKAARYVNQLQQQGLLQHPSLQGEETTGSPTEHGQHIGRTFALNLAQLDPQDEVDQIAQQLLSCTIAFAHGESIPRTVLLDCLLTDPDDLLAELLVVDGLDRLVTLGIVTLKRKESVQIHRLVAAYAAAELGEAAAFGQTTVEHHVLQLLETQFAQTRFVGNLPFAAAHLQKITTSALTRADDYGTQLALWWGRHLRDRGNLEPARDVLTTAVSLRRTLFPAGDLVLADLLSILGTLAWETGANQAAWPIYEEVITIRRQLLGENHTLTAQSIQNLAILHARSGALDTAQALYEEAIAIYKQLDPPDEQQISFTTFNLSILLRRMNHMDMAERQSQRSLQLREKLYGEDSPYVAQSLNSLGYQAMLVGQYEQALTFHNRALTIRRQTLGKTHAMTGHSLMNLGAVKSKMGKVTDAESDLQAALTIRQAQLPADHPHIGQSLSFLGQHFLRSDDVGQAGSWLEKGLQILTDKQPNHELTADAYVDLGNCYLREGEAAQARACFERAQQIQETTLAPSHLQTAYRLMSQGDLAQAEGDLAQARWLYETAKAIWEETAVSSHPDLLAVRKRLATLNKQGNVT